MKEKIIRLTKEHIKSAGEVLSRALYGDPMTIHVLPDNTERKLKLHHVYQMLVCLGVRWGEAYAISSNLEGIAVWIPYKTYKEYTIRTLRCSIKARLNKLGRGAGKRFKPIDKYNAEAHKEFAPNEHWYLQVIGVDPQNQGKGYGSALMKYMLEKIDENKVPVYLETSTEKNVKFYEKLEFIVMKEAIIPDTRVPVYYMLRK